MVMRMGWGSKEVHDTERNLIYSDKGTYGTSGFMTGSELHQVLMLVSDIRTCGGTILGRMGNKAHESKCCCIWCQWFHEEQSLCQKCHLPVCLQKI